MGDVIATKDLVVHDDAMGIDRKLFAGQPVPPDLVEAYRKEVGDEAADDEPTSPSYADQTVEDLEAEAEKRELEVEGTGKDGRVLKKDLVAALEADDAAKE